jgi:hypothetical protein
METSIEDFYKSNVLDFTLDETFYQSEYPETVSFFQPYCRDNKITDKQRLYYHWFMYGQGNCYKNYEEKMASISPEDYYKGSLGCGEKSIFLICNIYSQ